MNSKCRTLFLQGDNPYTESLCKTLLSVEELLEILTRNSTPILQAAHAVIRSPFLKFLNYVYLKKQTSASSKEVGGSLKNTLLTSGY